MIGRFLGLVVRDIRRPLVSSKAFHCTALKPVPITRTLFESLKPKDVARKIFETPIKIFKPVRLLASNSTAWKSGLTILILCSTVLIGICKTRSDEEPFEEIDLDVPFSFHLTEIYLKIILFIQQNLADVIFRISKHVLTTEAGMDPLLAVIFFSSLILSGFFTYCAYVLNKLRPKRDDKDKRFMEKLAFSSKQILQKIFP